MNEVPGLPAPEPVTFVVTVSGPYMGRVQEVARNLQTAGLQVDRVLGTLGQVHGHAEGSRQASIAAVEGVYSVDPERTYRINPPDSEIQ
ncbi:MAG: hypothetical protein Q4P23_00310 [Micrococcaceae bacterium]|nr:hypothetical protein [Micrococcaceae bacterium]